MKEDEDNGFDVGNNAEDNWDRGGAADAAAAGAAGGSLSRSSAADGLQRQEKSQAAREQPSMMPNNPLNDDSAVERWLQQVHLLQQQEHEQQGEEEGEAPVSLEGDAAEEKAQIENDLRRGQLCAQDNAAGTHEAFAETTETQANQQPPEAKLAETDSK